MGPEQQLNRLISHQMVDETPCNTDQTDTIDPAKPKFVVFSLIGAGHICLPKQAQPIEELPISRDIFHGYG